MSKILAIADIHLHDYPHRNSFPLQRLKQGSEIVAQNIIEVAEREGCEYIAICGDLIEKSIIRPYVQAAARDFLKAVMPHFKEGWIIWGNHDIDNKSSDQEETDSCLALILPDNLHYMHQKQIMFDGKRIGFNNWQPEINLEWVGDDKLDILFTHARICYKAGSDLFQSQYLDETKFDIAFCGDIHRPGTIGKYVSIGIPQRCKMSDGEEYTGVVIDTKDTTPNWWKWVDLNPNDNLMKFRYVDDPNQEGWNKSFNTWNIYRPDIDKFLDPSSGAVITGWDKIESLVIDKIRENGLEEVHRDVLSNITDIDAGEVDFNFTLLHFYCKNWRSITEASLNFEDGDKILITGENGSGKSSLLSAIKYAFCGDIESLKYFVQFGKESEGCVAEVEFTYQGNRYKLRRGNKDYGLWMNDEPMKYSSKTDFKADVKKRFPFIEYMEVMIHDQDHNQFIGSMSGERLAEIISKAFKLDRIDTYNDSATRLLDSTLSSSKDLEDKIREAQKVIEYIDSSLGSIIVPSQGRDELVKLKQEKEELQKKNYIWNQFLKTSSSLKGSIENLEIEEGDLKTKISRFRDPETINSEILGFKNGIGKLQSKVVEINGLKNTIEMKESELDRVKNSGKKLRKEIESIDPQKQNFCPTCHQPIPTDSNALEEKKKELEKEIGEVIKDYRRLAGELEELKKQFGNSEDILKEINSNIEALNTEITKRISELSFQEQIKGRLDYVEKKLEADRNSLNSLGAPEEVELPDDFMVELNRINQGIRDWDNYNNLCNDKEQQENLVAGYTVSLDKIRASQENLRSYITLTGPTGEIYESVLQDLVTRFNDSQVEYKVEVKEIRKKKRLTLTPYFRHNDKNKVPYEICSGGQKTVLDIHFLSKIINRMGILILDEFLKHLDPSNHDLCLDMINEMSVGCTFISSHMESIASFNNKICRLSLNENKLTEIELK